MELFFGHMTFMAANNLSDKFSLYGELWTHNTSRL